MSMKHGIAEIGADAAIHGIVFDVKEIRSTQSPRL